MIVLAALLTTLTALAWRSRISCDLIGFSSVNGICYFAAAVPGGIAVGRGEGYPGDLSGFNRSKGFVPRSKSPVGWHAETFRWVERVYEAHYNIWDDIGTSGGPPKPNPPPPRFVHLSWDPPTHAIGRLGWSFQSGIGTGWHFGFDFVQIPYWSIVTVAVSTGVGRRAVRVWISRRRDSIGRCRACCYDLRATPGRCPECGTVAAAA